MFEKSLKTAFETIFDFEKVTFDQPSDSREQECLFIEIQSSRNVITKGMQFARVQGRGTVYSPADKLPFGYLSKAIAQHPNETKDLFFFDAEENVQLVQNLVRRGFSFVYLFRSQYDPELGTITSIDTETEVS